MIRFCVRTRKVAPASLRAAENAAKAVKETYAWFEKPQKARK
jgi:hypothetical protein